MNQIHTMKEARDLQEKEVEIKNEVSDYVDEVSTLVINSTETFEQAANALVSLKRLSKKITIYFAPLKDAANKAHKAITTREKKELEPITLAESVIRLKRSEYKSEQDKIAAEEQRLLEEKERQRAAEEQDKLIEEAVQAQTPEQEEELLQKAEEVVAVPVFTPKAIENTTKVSSGGSTTWIKDIEIIIQDEKQICAGVCDGSIPLNIIEVKKNKLKTWAKSNDMKPGQYKGFIIKKADRESVRG